MDAYLSCILGCNYFISPDYFLLQLWIRVSFLFPSFISLFVTSVCIYVEIFLGWLGTRIRYTMYLYCGCGWCGTSISLDHLYISLNCLLFYVSEQMQVLFLVTTVGIYGISITVLHQLLTHKSFCPV